MSTPLTFAAKPRASLGTIATSKLRKEGLVPATLSRPGQPSLHFSFDLKVANEIDTKVAHLCRIDLEGQQSTALRGEVIKDCVTDKITHIDLIAVDEKSEIIVSVAVIPDARNCPGIKAGGIVEMRQRTIKVKCKATAIPDALSINLDEVQLTGVVLVEKVSLPAGTTLVTPGKTTLLSVVIPRGLKVVEEAKAADGAAAATTAAATAEGGKAPAAGAEGGKAPAGDAKAAPAKDAKK